MKIRCMQKGTGGGFDVVKNGLGEYEITDGKHPRPVGLGLNKDLKMMRKDFIFVKNEKSSFEDFKKNSSYNKCEQSLYITEVYGGYRIVESW